MAMADKGGQQSCTGFSKAVRELDLAPVAFKVALDERWPLEQVDEAEFQYRCFLQARIDRPDITLAPSRITDIFWHHHILDTFKYEQDCHALFGRFLHHFPYSGARGEMDEREQSRRAELSRAIINQIAEGERHAAQ